MESGGNDRDAEDALYKLLQMGTMAKYQNDFEMLINRVTGISESLLTSFYISGLKLTIQIELLRARPTTLEEAFSLARITEARFEAITEKEHIIKKKTDIILSLQSELASPEIKWSLDADEDIGVDEGGPPDHMRASEKELVVLNPIYKIMFRCQVENVERKAEEEKVGGCNSKKIMGSWN
ncbi:hypothetical protein Tco_1294358 [Tanacetum coccineum]